MILPNTTLLFDTMEKSRKYYGNAHANSMDITELLGEEIEEDEEVGDTKVIAEKEEDVDYGDEDVGDEVQLASKPVQKTKPVSDVAKNPVATPAVEDFPEEFSELDEDDEEEAPIVAKPIAPKESLAEKLKTKLQKKPLLKKKAVADDEDFDDEDKEEPPFVAPDIQTITHLSKYLRNENFKFTVFNIKGTLINYLEMFGERKVARHVLDQDAHAFYEIHASYIPGGVVYRVLEKLGFKPIHPTDLKADYPKDMSYDVAMSNGKLYINVFGGLQQHAHAEETVIRNLYARERMRYTQVPAPALGISASSALEFTNEKVSKNLLLASMQSHSLGKIDLSKSFFNEAMASPGIDNLILSMSEDYLEEDSQIFDEYQEQPELDPEYNSEAKASSKYQLYSPKKFKKAIPRLADYQEESEDQDDLDLDIFKAV